MPDGFCGVEVVAGLVDVGEFDGIAEFDGTGVGDFVSCDETEEGGFAGAVGADDSDDGVGREDEGEVLEEAFIAVGFGEVVGLDDFLAEAGAWGDEDFDLLFFFLDVLVEHGFVGGDAGFSLGLAGAWGSADPFEFALECALAIGFGFFFEGEAGLFLFEPGGVVTFPGDAGAAVEFEDPAGDVIEEVAVVGDGDDGAFVSAEVLFEPGDGFGVEVVGGFVEDEDVGFLEEESAEGDASAFAAGDDVDGGILGGASEGVHGHFEL